MAHRIISYLHLLLSKHLVHLPDKTFVPSSAISLCLHRRQGKDIKPMQLRQSLFHAFVRSSPYLQRQPYVGSRHFSQLPML